MLRLERNQGLSFFISVVSFPLILLFYFFFLVAAYVFQTVYILITVVWPRICTLLGKETQSTLRMKIAACMYSLLIGPPSGLAIE